mgnify:CR=1 FL=1
MNATPPADDDEEEPFDHEPSMERVASFSNFDASFDNKTRGEQNEDIVRTTKEKKPGFFSRVFGKLSRNKDKDSKAKAKSQQQPAAANAPNRSPSPSAQDWGRTNFRHSFDGINDAIAAHATNSNTNSSNSASSNSSSNYQDERLSNQIEANFPDDRAQASRAVVDRSSLAMNMYSNVARTTRDDPAALSRQVVDAAAGRGKR